MMFLIIFLSKAIAFLNKRQRTIGRINHIFVRRYYYNFILFFLNFDCLITARLYGTQQFYV